MAYSEQGSECLQCHKKAIEHHYSYNGEKFTEVLHQDVDGSVAVCTIGVPSSLMTRFWNDDYSDLPFDKEKARRQQHWNGRQLPPRFSSHTTVAPAIEADGQCKDAITTVTDDTVQSFTTEPTTAKTTADVGLASTETTFPDSHTNNNKENPSPASVPGYKIINDWADFWRYDIGVNVISANTRKKETY